LLAALASDELPIQKGPLLIGRKHPTMFALVWKKEKAKNRI